MRAETTVALSIVIAFLIPDVFCFSREQDMPMMQYLDKRMWYPTHTYEIQLFCKLGKKYLNHPAEKVRHYGCYCGGSSADMKDYIKRDVKPKDDLDKCCKVHKECLRKFTSQKYSYHCSFDSLKKCESGVIDCIANVQVRQYTSYINYDRSKCR